MCGIGGQIHFDGTPVSSETLQALGDAMEHRGRDGSGVYHSGPVGLVHRRLSIIDLSSGGHQPMETADGAFVIAFNGEVFNYKELRRELEGEGVSFRSNSDTEALLLAYRQYGIEMLDRIEGMFAFAIWDREAGELICARDRIGIKPLYYFAERHGVTFASEIKALVKSGVCRPAIDYHGFKEYIHLQTYLNGRTMFRGVTSLEPGMYLRANVADGKFKLLRYWDFPDGSETLDYDNAVEGLRERISQAVQLWSRADVPISSYISGGLDSSAVATLASRCLDVSRQQTLHTFSSIYPGFETRDEQEFSDCIATEIRSDHHRLRLANDQVVKDHEDLLYVLDMPIAGYSAAYRTLSREVRRVTKVVLTGHGGDELLAGYPKYFVADAAYRALSENNGTSNDHLDGCRRYLSGFETQVQQMMNRCRGQGVRGIFSAVFFRSAALWNEVDPEIQREVADYDIVERLMAISQRNCGSFLQQILAVDRKILLPALLHVEDRTSMIENLESRTPLLDRGVVEFATRLPESFLLKNGLKGMMRASMHGVLPDPVRLNTRKSGTMHPTTELLDGALQSLFAEDLSHLERSNVFRRSPDRILEECSQLSNRRMTWALWSMGAWLRAFSV